MIKRVFTFSFFLGLFFLKTTFSQSYYDYELSAINFSGNSFFSESDLEQNIESKESPNWFWVFLNSFTPLGDERVYFDSSKISVDEIALKEYYKSSGFFNISITHDIAVDTVQKTVELNYHITENNYLKFGKLNLIGLDKLSEYYYGRMISETITIDSLNRFSEFEVQDNISAIRRFLANNGYIFGRYDSTIVSIDTVTERTDLDIYFESGGFYTISGTIINKTGISAEQINNKLIAEIADFTPGKFYNQSQVDRSEMRLLKTELFTSLYITPVMSDTFHYTIPIEINATIGSLNELSPEIKTDNEFESFNFGLGISYTRKNLFGDARKFNISTSFRLIDILHTNLSNLFKSAPNRDSTYQGVIDINLKMEQPFLFGRPILTTTEIYFRSQTLKEFTENSYGGAQRFDIEMPPYTFVTLFRPFISIDVAERSSDFKITDNTLISDYYVSINSLTPGIGIELGSSKTNDILFPTKGSLLFFTPELFHSSSDYNFDGKSASDGSIPSDFKISGNTYFYRIQTGLTNYFSLNSKNDFIFATKLRGGYAQPFTASNGANIRAESLIPPNKTFYAGGSNSVRGWGARDLVPFEKIEYLGVTTDSSQIRGGTSWFEGSIELREKLHKYFGYAVFVDFGNTWNGWNDVRIDDVAVAVGVGLRVYTPIAPFRLDFGTKFYDPSDQKLIFKKNFWENITLHFGIGEAF